MRAIFSETKLDPINDILLDNGILTVFGLYLSELLMEVLRPLRHEAPVQILPEIRNISPSTRNQTKGLLQSKYYRTVTKKKSVENSLTNGVSLYVIDNRNLFTMFFFWNCNISH